MIFPLFSLVQENKMHTLRRGALVCALTMIGLLAGTILSMFGQSSSHTAAVRTKDAANGPNKTVSARIAHRKGRKSAAMEKGQKTAKAAPQPELPFGPPLLPERAAVARPAHRLMQALQDRRMVLVHPT